MEESWACGTCTLLNDASLSSCDACGSLRGGSSAIEIEAGNDVLVAARACFSEVEQGVAANHVLYKDAAAAARAAAANREAPLTHSFAAKTLPRVVEVMLDQSSPSALYAQDIEETVLGALRFWGWALQHNLWDGLQCVTIILDWDQHFYTGGKVLYEFDRVRRPAFFNRCLGIVVRDLLHPLLAVLRGMLLDPSQEQSAAPLLAEAAVLPSLASESAQPPRIAPAAWVSPKATEVYCTVLVSILRSLDRTLRHADALRGVLSYPVEGCTISELQDAALSGRATLEIFCEALAALPNDVLKRDSVAVCECMKGVSAALLLLLGRSSQFLHRIQRALIESALQSNNFQRRRWGLDELTAYLLSDEAGASGTPVDLDVASLVESTESNTQPVPHSDFDAAEWLVGPRVQILDLLLGDSTHEELLRKAGPVLAVLARSRALTHAHVDRMWRATLSAHATSADAKRELLASFVESAIDVAPELVTHLCKLMSDTAEDPNRFADVALAVAKIARLLSKEADTFDKSTSTRLSHAEQRRSAKWLPIIRLFLKTLQHKYAPTLSLASVFDVGAKETHDEQEDNDENAEEPDNDSISSDSDGGSSASADGSDLSDGDPVKTSTPRDPVVDVTEEAESKPRAHPASHPSSTLATFAGSLDAEDEGASLCSRYSRDNRLAGLFVSLWSSDLDVTRAVDCALGEVSTGLCRWLDMAYNPTWTQDIFVIVLNVIKDIALERDELVYSGILDRLASQGQALRATTGTTAYRDFQTSVAEHIACMHPSTDPVPRALELMKALLRHMHRFGMMWSQRHEQIELGFVPPASLGMTDVVTQCQRYCDLISILLLEASSFARHTPSYVTRPAGLSKRLGVVYMLTRYAKETWPLDVDTIEDLFIACNQWPSYDIIQRCFEVSRAPPSPADSPIGTPISASSMAAVASLATVNKIQVSLECHDLREVFWTFLRRLIGGGAYDASSTILAGQKATHLTDPEDLFETAGSTYIDDVFPPSRRIGYVAKSTESLLSESDIPLLFDRLFSFDGFMQMHPSLATAGLAALTPPRRAPTTPSRASPASGTLELPAFRSASLAQISPGQAHQTGSDIAEYRRAIASFANASDLVCKCRCVFKLKAHSIGPAGFDCFSTLWLSSNGPNQASRISALQESINSGVSATEDGAEGARGNGTASKRRFGLVTVRKTTADVQHREFSAEFGLALPVSLQLGLQSLPHPESGNMHAPQVVFGLEHLAELALCGCSPVARNAISLLVDTHVALQRLGLAAWSRASASTRSRGAASVPLALSHHDLVILLVKRIRLSMSGGIRNPETRAAISRSLSILHLYIKRLTAAVAEDVCAMLSVPGSTARLSPAEVLQRFKVQSHKERCGDASSGSTPSPSRSPLRGALGSSASAAVGFPEPLELSQRSAVNHLAGVYKGSNDCSNMFLGALYGASDIVPGLAQRSSVSFSFVQPEGHYFARPCDADISTVWNSLQLTEDIYELLFRILGGPLCLGVIGHDLRDLTWEILMDLPTAPTFDAALMHPAGVQWNDLLSQPATDKGLAGAPAHNRVLFAPTDESGATSGGDDRSNSGEAWRALYCLQAVAARIMRDSSSTAMQVEVPASSPSLQVSWRREFIDKNGLRVVLQQLIRTAPPKAALRSRASPGTTLESFDFQLSRDITAVALRILLHCRTNIRERDLQLRPTRGSNAVKPIVGLRLLIARLFQALWIATGAGGRVATFLKAQFPKKTAAENHVDITTATTAVTIIQYLLSRTDLLAPSAVPTSSSARQASVLQIVGVEVLGRSDTLQQLGDMLATPIAQLRSLLVNSLVKPCLADLSCGPVITAIFSRVVEEGISRLDPISPLGLGFIAALREILAHSRRLDSAAGQSTMLYWFAFLAQRIASWWADIYCSVDDSMQDAGLVEAKETRATVASESPLPPSLLKYVYLSADNSRGTTASASDADVRPSKLKWKISSPKPLLSAILDVFGEMCNNDVFVASLFVVKVPLLWPRLFLSATTVIPVPSPTAMVAPAYSSPVPLKRDGMSFNSTHSSGSERKQRRRVLPSLGSESLAPATLVMWQIFYDIIVSCCLFGPAGGRICKDSSEPSQRPVYLCHDASERDAAFTSLRSLMQLLSASGDAALAEVSAGILQSVAKMTFDSARSKLVSSPLLLHSEADSALLPFYEASLSENAIGGQERADSGFVGLVNIGCTCYANALLQQIYMTPELRKLILQADIPVPEDVRRDFVGTSDKAATGDDAQSLVGAPELIQTPGADQTREAADSLVPLSSSTPALESAGVLRNEGTQLSSNITTSSLRDIRLLLELQRTFLWLRSGHIRAYTPTSFIDSCAKLGLPNAVRQQNDASEFCDLLMGSVEGLFKPYPSQLSNLQRIVGGASIPRKQRLCCGRVDKGDPARFVFISLPVAGQSLREALRAKFKAEELTGDNAVFCESCNRKSTTRIQECITCLPQLLVLHLIRFKFDFDDGNRVVKLNNRFTFPRRLDMRPFTAAGLADRDRASGEISSHSKDAEPVIEEDVGGFDYELVGVLVHRGTAQDGHYYSFIKDRGDCTSDMDTALLPCSNGSSAVNRVRGSNKWFRFDDSNVTAFDPRDIPKEAFGGTVTVMEQRNAYPFTEVAVEKPVLQNAFMLFYERRSRSRMSSSPSSDIHPAAVPVVAKSSSAEAVGRDQLLPCRSRSVLMPILHQIDSSNQQVARNAFLIDPALPRFLVSVAEDLVTKTLVRSGTSATSVCSWLTSANDALAAHLKSATFRPAMTVQQQFSHASVAPPRVPFVPALTLLVDSKLSEALSVVGTLSESTLRVRVTQILASAAVRGSGISGVEMPYQVGATHMSEGDSSKVYLESSAAKERRRPIPLFRFLAFVFLEIVLPARIHDMGSLKLARALILLMHMQPASARWFLLQLQCATIPQEVTSSSPPTTRQSTNAAEMAYRTHLARGLLLSASESSRDLLLRILEAAVVVVSDADSRGKAIQGSSRKADAPQYATSALSPVEETEIIRLGLSLEDADAPFLSSEAASSALYSYPLDHDLMSLHKVDATRCAEASAREAHDAAAEPCRAQARILMQLEGRLEKAKADLAAMEARVEVSHDLNASFASTDSEALDAAARVVRDTQAELADGRVRQAALQAVQDDAYVQLQLARSDKLAATAYARTCPGPASELTALIGTMSDIFSATAPNLLFERNSGRWGAIIGLCNALSLSAMRRAAPPMTLWRWWPWTWLPAGMRLNADTGDGSVDAAAIADRRAQLESAWRCEPVERGGPSKPWLAPSASHRSMLVPLAEAVGAGPVALAAGLSTALLKSFERTAEADYDILNRNPIPEWSVVVHAVCALAETAPHLVPGIMREMLSPELSSRLARSSTLYNPRNYATSLAALAVHHALGALGNGLASLQHGRAGAVLLPSAPLADSGAHESSVDSRATLTSVAGSTTSTALGLATIHVLPLCGWSVGSAPPLRPALPQSEFIDGLTACVLHPTRAAAESILRCPVLSALPVFSADLPSAAVAAVLSTAQTLTRASLKHPAEHSGYGSVGGSWISYLPPQLKAAAARTLILHRSLVQTRLRDLRNEASPGPAMWSLIDIEALGSVLNLGPARLSLSIGPVLAPLLRPSPPKQPSALARGLSDVSRDSVDGDGDGFTPLTQLQELSPLHAINSMRVLCGLGSPFMVEHPGSRAFLRVNPEIFAVLQQLSPWLLPLLAHARPRGIITKPINAMYDRVPPAEDLLDVNPHISPVLADLLSWDAAANPARDELVYILARALAFSWGRRCLHGRVITAARILQTKGRVQSAGTEAEAALASPASEAVRRMPLPPSLTRSMLMLVGPSAIRFRVSGAGVRVVNGIYSLSILAPQAECPVFVRRVGSLTLTISRFQMRDSCFQWYISAPAFASHYSHDHDLYMCSERNRLAPGVSPAVWTAVESLGHSCRCARSRAILVGRAPAPRVEQISGPPLAESWAQQKPHLAPQLRAGQTAAASVARAAQPPVPPAAQNISLIERAAHSAAGLRVPDVLGSSGGPVIATHAPATTTTGPATRPQLPAQFNAAPSQLSQTLPAPEPMRGRRPGVGPPVRRPLTTQEQQQRAPVDLRINQYRRLRGGAMRARGGRAHQFTDDERDDDCDDEDDEDDDSDALRDSFNNSIAPDVDDDVDDEESELIRMAIAMSIQEGDRSAAAAAAAAAADVNAPTSDSGPTTAESAAAAAPSAAAPGSTGASAPVSSQSSPASAARGASEPVAGPGAGGAAPSPSAAAAPAPPPQSAPQAQAAAAPPTAAPAPSGRAAAAAPAPPPAALPAMTGPHRSTAFTGAPPARNPASLPILRERDDDEEASLPHDVSGVDDYDGAGDGSSSEDGMSRSRWRHGLAGSVDASVYPAPPRADPAPALQEELVARYREVMPVPEEEARRALRAVQWSLDDAIDFALGGAD